MRRCVVVMGMHRSGTSAMAGALRQVGLRFASQLVAPSKDNPKGHFEDATVLALHERILAELNSSWSDVRELDLSAPGVREALAPHVSALGRHLRDQFADSSLFALKDPRLTHLAPLWSEVFDQAQIVPHYVVIVRPPQEVAASLATRECFDPALSHVLWTKAYLDAEKNTRGQRRIFISYRNLLADPVATLERVAEGLELPLELSAENREAVCSFVDSSLNRSRKRVGGTGDQVPPAFATELLEVLEKRSSQTGGGDETFRAACDDLQARFLADPLRRLVARCQGFLRDSIVMFQIFPGHEEGFTDETSLGRLYQSGVPARFSERLVAERPVTQIVVDPADRSGILTGFRLGVRCGDQTLLRLGEPIHQAPQVKLSNLIAIDAHCLIATSDDPRIIIPCRGEAGCEIHVECEFCFQKDSDDLPAYHLSAKHVAAHEKARRASSEVQAEMAAVEKHLQVIQEQLDSWLEYRQARGEQITTIQDRLGRLEKSEQADRSRLESLAGSLNELTCREEQIATRMQAVRESLAGSVNDVIGRDEQSAARIQAIREMLAADEERAEAVAQQVHTLAGDLSDLAERLEALERAGLLTVFLRSFRKANP